MTEADDLIDEEELLKQESNLSDLLPRTVGKVTDPLQSFSEPRAICPFFKTKRSYVPVAFEKKRELILRVGEGATIKEAAVQLNINYSTAKHIVKLYRSQNLSDAAPSSTPVNSRVERDSYYPSYQH